MNDGLSQASALREKRRANSSASTEARFIVCDERSAHTVDPDLAALMHLHACEYSATGYFGNKGSDTDFYIYCCT